MATELQKMYSEVVVPKLMERFGYKNIFQAPRVEKIVLNMGLGADAADKKLLERALKELSDIAGQKAVVTHAHKSIAGFKIREGWPIGCKVTLRREQMYNFLLRLLYIAIPRIRDFRGLNPKAFDGRGNFSMGIKEQIVFPEINYEETIKLMGLDICIATTANTNEEALALLQAFEFPFKGSK